MKRERNSWLLSTVIFFIAMQLWTTAHSGFTGLVTAAASDKSPGEMDPTTLSMLIGGNGNITCRLSKANSSKIWFYETKTKRKIRQPTAVIKVIDPYTAMLIIDDAVEQNSRYECRIGYQAIGETEVYVGTKPQNVTNFSCVVYDYVYMRCSFTKPKNMLLTSFQLEYIFGRNRSILNSTDSANDTLQYNVNDYLPVRNKSLFTLTGTNAGGENTQNFSINNHEIVIPSAIDITIQNVTSESITLTWQYVRIFFYPMGLLYEIQVSDDNRTNWHTPQMEDLECQNVNCKVVIKNLYAYWHYWIKVRAKANTTEQNNNHFWSDATTKQFQTIGKPPKRAPKTPLGSFYIDSSETQLRLYWEPLQRTEYNGPDFHYVVNEINRHNVVMLSIKTNETTTAFAWKNQSMQIFTVNSANNYGESNDSSIIRVFRSASPRNELNENTISKVYHNTSYTLSWSPPENLDELMSYTVFWCLPKIELPNQCKGPISYKYLDKLTTNFTTEPKDRSLNLALSANYPNYSKGMQWARCSGDISSELMKMELEVTALNKSAILVKWSSGIVCASILKGYNLTYCQESNGRCSPVHTVELLRDKHNYRNYTITGLPPFTNVCIRMLMFSSNKNGRNSEENCVRTKENAPSPPKNIKYLPKTVTSKSAVVEWKPPELSNGILSHYTIYWRKHPDNTFEKNSTSIENTNYTLTGLSSYSSYEVYVTAHTVEESLPSSRINLTTLIGIPSSPRNLNIYENDTVIYWDQPYLPSGRHLFYVVALLRRDNNQYDFVYERVSPVKGRSCRFQLPDCSNTNKTYILKVRAVNVGERNEIDTEINSMTKDEILDRTPIDENFCKSDEEEESFITRFQTSNKFHFASPWIDAPRRYSCSTSSNALIYAVAAFVVISAFAVCLCYWMRNKYYKMKNIKVILPEGLVDQVSNYKFANNSLDKGSNLGSSSKKEFHSDISRSNDCLVAFGHKENLNLMSNFRNGSSNALSSLSSNSISKEQLNEDQTGEHPSLETTNEELSSNSSSVSNSNLTYHEHRQKEKLSPIDSNNTVPASAYEQGDEQSNQDNPPNLNATQNAGYVTHNSHFLSSLLNATDRNAPPLTQFNTNFPDTANDGYIQPHVAKQLFQPSLPHQDLPSTNALNGYTSIEDIGRRSILPTEITQHNVATSIVNSPQTNSTPTNAHQSMGTMNMPLDPLPANHHHQQTSPVITDLNETITDLDFHKDRISLPNVNNQPNPTTLTSQQPNNNNNTIYGYVTQQQLANFGTNVALGKELNT